MAALDPNRIWLMAESAMVIERQRREGRWQVVSPTGKRGWEECVAREKSPPHHLQVVQ